jgi:hypothetical protein
MTSTSGCVLKFASTAWVLDLLAHSLLFAPSPDSTLVFLFQDLKEDGAEETLQRLANG